MGVSISYVGVSGISRDEILQRLSLKDSGEPDEYNETPLSIATSGDWTVIWSNDLEYFSDEPLLASLSSGARIVVNCVEEHVMFFSAEEWRDGQRVWRVTHDSQTSNDHIAVEGAPPPGHVALLADMRRQQETDSDVDYISEVPVVLAQEITGFRYGEDSDFSFTALVRGGAGAAPKKKGWFR